MEIKDRIFPYPVLNNNKSISNYNDLNFNFLYEREESDDNFILKNSKIETDSELINSLLTDKKIKVFCIVECSNTVYRKAFEVSTIPIDICLNKNDLNGDVAISVYAVANDSFILSSDEFEDEYRNINFEIEKNNILAAYDGFTINFLHEEKADNLAQSIFSIISDYDMESGESYIVECEDRRKISISMSKEEYLNYKKIYENSNYKEIFFNLLLVPALVEALTQCKASLKDDDKDLDDIPSRFPWFRSIMNGYNRLNNKELTLEEFKNCSIIKLSQDLLGKPFGEALKNLDKLSRTIITDEEE